MCASCFLLHWNNSAAIGPDAAVEIVIFPRWSNQLPASESDPTGVTRARTVAFGFAVPSSYRVTRFQTVLAFVRVQCFFNGERLLTYRVRVRGCTLASAGKRGSHFGRFGASAKWTRHKRIQCGTETQTRTKWELGK